eukprot:12073815-Karenia_brevis.AAC.1
MSKNWLSPHHHFFANGHLLSGLPCSLHASFDHAHSRDHKLARALHFLCGNGGQTVNDLCECGLLRL